MDALGPQYRDAFRQHNIVAIAYPTMPMPAPLLSTDGDAVPPTFEVNGRQYQDTAILRNSFSAPAFRAPALSTPAGLTSEGLPAGLELDGLPGEDNQLLRSHARSRDRSRSHTSAAFSWRSSVPMAAR